MAPLMTAKLHLKYNTISHLTFTEAVWNGVQGQTCVSRKVVHRAAGDLSRRADLGVAERGLRHEVERRAHGAVHPVEENEVVLGGRKGVLALEAQLGLQSRGHLRGLERGQAPTRPRARWCVRQGAGGGGACRMLHGCAGVCVGGGGGASKSFKACSNCEVHRAQRQLLRCLSREHPGKTPTYRSVHDPFKTASGVQNSGPWDPWLLAVENSRLFARRGHSARFAPCVIVCVCVRAKVRIPITLKLRGSTSLRSYHYCKP